MNISKKNLGLFFILLSLISCKEDEFPFNPTDSTYYTSWNPHPAVQFDNIHLQNAYATDDRLYVLGANHFLTFDENHELINDYLISKEAIYIGIRYQPTVTEKIFGYYDYESGNNRSKLKLHLNENPAISTTIDLETFNTKWRLNSRNGNQFVVTPDNELILPVIYTDVDGGGINDTSVIKMVSFDLTISENSLEATLKDSLLIFREEERVYYLANKGMFFQNEQLYFTLDFKGLFQINWTTKESSYVTDLTRAFFMPMEDTFFIAGHTVSDYLLQFNFATTNPPTQWNLYKFGYYDNGFMRFDKVQNQIIGYRLDDMLHFITDYPNNQIHFKAIVKEDLNTNIEKIIEFRDRVYLVSATGLFHKKTENFFNYRRY
jgi:hypothetical protein